MKAYWIQVILNFTQPFFKKVIATDINHKTYSFTEQNTTVMALTNYAEYVVRLSAEVCVAILHPRANPFCQRLLALM